MTKHRSNHPNDVHQLMVAPSKYYYLGEDGLLKCQKKPMELELADVPHATRQHMVTYVLRDHCSTLLYAEVCFGPTLMPLRSFLARAWDKKPNIPLRGLPNELIVARAVMDTFPDALQAVSGLGVLISPATSGFQNGIHGALAVEKWLSPWIDKPVDEGQRWLRFFCEGDGDKKMRRTKQRKIDCWQASTVPVRELPPGWGVGGAA